MAKLQESQIKDLAQSVFDEWMSQGLVTFKVDQKKAFELVLEELRKENFRIADFEKEVRSLLDDLERKNPQGMDRHKMYLLLKQRMAKEKGIIL